MKVPALVTAVIVLLAAEAYAQQRPEPAPAPAPVPPAPVVRPPTAPAPAPLPPTGPAQLVPRPPAPPREQIAPVSPAGQLVNIRIDVTIKDERTKSSKAVSLTLADRQSGSVRSSDRTDGENRWLNIDVLPVLQKDGRVNTQVTLEYGQPPGLSVRSIRTQVLLESGKSLVSSQAASPTSDDRVSLELMATVLK